MMDNCDKCGTVVPYHQCVPLYLMSIYSAVLCVPCRNTYEKWIRSLPEWEEYVLVLSRKGHLAAMTLAGTCPSEEALLANARADHRLRIVFFDLIGEWMNEQGSGKSVGDGSPGSRSNM